jgi:hypothetical protein
MNLLRKIEKGAVDPSGIAPSDRRQLVGFLTGDGYSAAEIAQILQVGDRTIERDKRAIRESNAIARDPKLVEQMVGRLVGEAELSVQRIRKAVRDKKVSPSVKVDAEHRCFQVVNDLVQSLQRLGYLPTAAQKVEADLTHHVGDVPDFGTTRAEVVRLKEICQQHPKRDPEVVQRVLQLERQVAEADLATQVENFKDQITDTEGGSDDHE